MTESAEQKVLAQWLDLTGALWLHVPNEGKRSYRTAALLRAMGLKKGAPDVLIFSPPPFRPGKVGVAIELKSLTGRTSREQLWWLERLEERGWVVSTCYGADKAIDWLRCLGYGTVRG